MCNYMGDMSYLVLLAHIALQVIDVYMHVIVFRGIANLSYVVHAYVLVTMTLLYQYYVICGYSYTYVI